MSRFISQSMQLSLHPSNYLAVTLAVAHLGAIACVWFALPWYLAMALSIIVLCNGYWLYIDKVALISQRAIRQLSAISATDWCLIDQQGVHYAHLRGDSVLSSFLLILNFDIIGQRRRHCVIICADSCDQRLFRRLRVYLS